MLAERLRGVAITLSSDVSPEMREYERFSTACAQCVCPAAIGRYRHMALDRVAAEAEPIARRGAGDRPLTETRSAFMRYRGQGREIAVQLPTRAYRDEDAALLHVAFEDAYRRLYSRVIPGVEIEVLSWVILLSAPRPDENETVAPTPEPHTPEPARWRPVFDDLADIGRETGEPGHTWGEQSGAGAQSQATGRRARCNPCRERLENIPEEASDRSRQCSSPSPRTPAGMSRRPS
jgi:N-methylhydantoinase A/oxoprolinase/acetone carboxylase beta subunit